MDVKQLFENFKTVVTQHYADFNGRASRAVFWQYTLVYTVVFALLFWVLGLRLIANLLSLALLLPSLGVSVRRLHDIGKSGWLVLLPVIPWFLTAAFMFVFWPLTIVSGLAGLICVGYLIYLYTQPGVAGSNEFGPAPDALAA
jgi:uncharacterized membrane protein YhaH (DUF805 family)